MKKPAVFIIHAFTGWALCAAVMGVGTAFLPINTVLIIHAAAAPVIFFAVSFVYFKFFHYTRPLPTAALFTAFVILMDFFVVALLVLKSFDMFKSPIGTWVPFALIFLSAWTTGLALKSKKV